MTRTVKGGGREGETLSKSSGCSHYQGQLSSHRWGKEECGKKKNEQEIGLRGEQ